MQNSHHIADMLSGSLSEDEIVAIFVDMERNSLQVSDLVEGAKAMREVMVAVELPGDPIDTCGTGGSGKRTINTSTLVAFTLAAMGVPVAKHGNRSASGNCGCFDVLEALGVQIELSPEEEQKVYDELGIVFLFAKVHHPAMRHVVPARKRYGKKTLFNLLGPLCNPAVVKRQMVGTGNGEDAGLIAGALKELGCEAGLVVTGEDGLDEVSVCAGSVGISVPSLETIDIHPVPLGIDLCSHEEIEGGTPEENVQIVQDIASGKGPDAMRNLIVLNTLYALTLVGPGSGSGSQELGGPEPEPEPGTFQRVQETLSSGIVSKLIDSYIQATNDFS